jgi:hypothetical protein
MSRKPTYKELEQKIQKLEKEIKMLHQPEKDYRDIFNNSPETIIFLD